MTPITQIGTRVQKARGVPTTGIVTKIKRSSWNGQTLYWVEWDYFLTPDGWYKESQIEIFLSDWW